MSEKPVSSDASDIDSSNTICPWCKRLLLHNALEIIVIPSKRASVSLLQLLTTVNNSHPAIGNVTYVHSVGPD